MKRIISLIFVLLSLLALTSCSKSEGTQGLKYSGLVSNSQKGVDSYTVSGYDGKDQDVVIPATHKGLPVVSIDEHAFFNNQVIKSVTIQNGVRSIGMNAFDGCENLESVILSDSIELINYDPFSRCTNLKFNVFGDCRYLGTADNPYHALLGVLDDGTDELKLHNDTKVICYRAFRRNKKIESLELPEGIVSIGSFAFDDCDGIKSLTLPKGLKRIDAYAFFDCDNIESVEIPEGVIYIGSCAFNDLDKLTSVTLPKSLESIGVGAFDDSDKLISLSFGETAGWYCRRVSSSQKIEIPETELVDKRNAVIMINHTYDEHNWIRKVSEETE